MKNKKLLTIIQILLVLVLIFSLYKIGIWFIQNNKTKENLKQIGEHVEEKIIEEVVDNKIVEKTVIEVDFNELNKINSDTVGYLKVNNTKIDYPIVKTTDNHYYLWRSFDKSYNEAGWVFADYKNNIDGSDKNIVIYGHDRKDGSLFGGLDSTLESSWYTNEENKEITFVTEEGYYIYEIFSIYTVTNEDYYITTEFSSNEFETFITTIKNRSITDFGTDISKDDNILTLSTCYQGGALRMVVHAKLIDEI